MEQKPIEDLLPRAGGSVYRLVRMAARRALELSEGKPTLVQNIVTDKVATIALEEIKQGKIEAKEAIEQREKRDKETTKQRRAKAA